MIRLSIRRPVAVTMAYLAIALLGVAAWRNVPIELLPDTDLPRLQVEAELPGASPETTEALLTSPLEAVIQQVRGVERIVSESRERFGVGRALITVHFARETDMDFARLELGERIASIEEELPPATRPITISPYIPREFQDQRRPFLRYTITGPYTVEALRAHVDDVIVPELAQVDGVATVIAEGGRDRVLEIVLDETRVLSLRLSLTEVARRISELEYVRHGGTIEEQGIVRALAIRQRPGSAAVIERTPLLSDGGRIVRVGDVARIHDTFEDPTSYYRIDGQPAVSFTVLREPGTNAVAVADRAKERLAAIEHLNPPGTRLILDDDESDAIRAQLTDLRFRALISAGVIFVILLLFLGSLRSAAIVFATIAFSILITLNLIYFAGLTLNVLTLMGLAMGFGLVVDNAIVVLENIYRLRRTGLAAPEAAERGAREVVLAILAATLTTVVVLIPFVYLQGELRVFYVPLAIVVGFSLIASIGVAFTFIPSLAARILDGLGATRGPEGALAEGNPATRARRPWYVRTYAVLIGFTLRHPWVTVALSVIALGGSFYLFDKYVPRGIVWGRWGGQDTKIDVLITLPRGEELERMDELVRYFEAKLAATPEVERFVSRVDAQRGWIEVFFPDSLELTQVPVAIKEQMVAFSHQFGGADVRVYGYGPSFYGGGGSPPNYTIKVLGYNYETVQKIAEDLATRLRRFSRIRDVDTNSAGRWVRDKATELVLRIDRDRLAMHDLTAVDVVRHVQSAVRSEAFAGRITLAGEEVRLGVKLDGSRDMDVLGLESLLIPTRSGTGVRLGEVATIEEREVLGVIVRENQQYQRNVSYEFRGPTKLGDRVHQAVMETTELPPGYTLEKDEGWGWSSEEKGQIYGVLAVALVLIFMVTAALFESVRQPLCVLLTVPMALVGVFLIFFYAKATFTREAYIGVIMMSGIVVNNAILLVDHINQRRRRDGLPLVEATMEGTIERVRPILMTSVSTVLGLLPLVLFSESADANIWNALGYALIGGLTSSTILVLAVTPALYLLLERGPEKRRAR